MSKPTTQQPAELSPEGKALAKRLGSRKSQERQKAEQQIQAMGKAGRDLLIAIMRHEEQRRRNQRKELRWKLALKIALFGIPTLLLFVVGGRLVIVNMLLCNLIGFLLGSMIVAAIVTRAHTNAAYLLAKHFDDVSIIGPMAEALEYRSRAVREAATAALIRLLPRLQEADFDLLTAEQRSSLHRALMSKNSELVDAILNTLQQVCDGTAIPNVQKLAAGLGVAGADRRIQQRAQQVLLDLRQRAEAQRAPTILLRPSAAGEVGTEVLLRPVVVNANAAPEQLLRPTTGITQNTEA